MVQFFHILTTSRSFMKYSILLSMTFDLLSQQSLTARYLAEKHSLSPRTVYRYVEILSRHLPLQIKRGRNGGICLADNYKLPVGFMHAEEYEAAIVALDLAYSKDCEERFLLARRKLSSQKKTEAKNLALFADTGNLFLDSSAFGDVRTFAEKLRIVEECIKKKLVLSIVYLDENEQKVSQHIEPHALVFDRGAWFVYAFGHDARIFSLYRLGRIFSVFKTDTVFRKRPFPRDDLPFPSRIAEKVIHARFEIKKEALIPAQDWLGAECMRYKNGSYFAEVTLPDEENLPAKIMSMGKGFKVLEPASLQEKVTQTAQEVAKLYS